MKRAKKLLSLLIAAILLVSLSSCGGSKGGGENEAALGKYNALTYSFGDMTLDATGDWLELKSKGKATISVDGDEFACKWKLNGTDFTLEERGDIFKGTLENGVIELNLEGIVYTFAKPGFEPATSPESEEAPVVTAAQDLADSEYADEIAYWNGDWYGWWWITSAAGDWAHLSEKYYDMYCTINLDADGMGQMMFWDDDAGLMKLEVKLDTNNSAPHGILVSTKGYLWDFDYKPGEWVIDVEDNGLDYENLWTFEGTYIDPTPDEAGSQFDYFICMRPWGQNWDDIEDAGERPPGYDWYVGELSSGNTMPEGLGYGVLSP